MLVSCLNILIHLLPSFTDMYVLLELIVSK
jgi:hypothetical protein